MKRRIFMAGMAAGGVALALSQSDRLSTGIRIAHARVRPHRTLDEVLADVGPAARENWRALFVAAGRSYPPRHLTLIGLKQEKLLEVWDAAPDARPVLIAAFPILAASGGAGPKLREGDRQVPEGIYRITYLNPNSAFHLSMRIDYPSNADRARAAEEGRGNLGGDIMIHGEGGSVGCLSMADEVAELLFVLAADTGIRNIQLILSPHDMRRHGLPRVTRDMPRWMGARYRRIQTALAPYR